MSKATTLDLLNARQETVGRAVDLCTCGHPSTDHVRLPGFPGGCEECQADDCECGEYREAGGGLRPTISDLLAALLAALPALKEAP